MLYRVQAKPIEAMMPELHRLLANDTIARQEPDGSEIVASMKRAVFKNGQVEWYETCYCNPPLNHERSTVYNKFFSEMTIEPAGTIPAHQIDTSFWTYLKNESSRHEADAYFAGSGSMTRVLGRNTV